MQENCENKLLSDRFATYAKTQEIERVCAQSRALQPISFSRMQPRYNAVGVIVRFALYIFCFSNDGL